MLTPHVKGLLSVHEISQCLKQLIKDAFPFVAVYGEISNLKTSNGITYFTLKDAFSQISVVIFRNTIPNLQYLNLKEGSSIIIEGKLDLYIASGRYQIIAHSIQLLGTGKLQQAFEQLKQKFQAEGLFDANKKLPFPQLPKHIGLITAPNSAAFQDFIKILQRKNWKGFITLAPVLVQGDRAPSDICKAFRTLENNPAINAIVIIRGGGSFEDLNCFNNENLIRTLAKRKKPLLSGIGHEIDYTLCDFVADLRAETPTAAAEWLASNYNKQLQQIAQLTKYLQIYIQANIQKKKQQIQIHQTRLKLAHPIKIFTHSSQQLKKLQQTLKQNIQIHIQNKNQKLNLSKSFIQSPTLFLQIKQSQQKLKFLQKNLKLIYFNQAKQFRKTFKNLEHRLFSLSIEKQLQKGFIIPLNHTGKNPNTISFLQVGQTYNIQHLSGKFNMQITDKLH